MEKKLFDNVITNLNTKAKTKTKLFLNIIKNKTVCLDAIQK